MSSVSFCLDDEDIRSKEFAIEKVKNWSRRRRSSLSAHEEDIFLSVFKQVASQTTDYEAHEAVMGALRRLKKIVFYNAPCGTQLSGRILVSSFRTVRDFVTEDDLWLACVLGWCVEIMQAAFFILEDMVDGSERRHGDRCWYLGEGRGNIVIADAFLLSGYVYYIIRKYFSCKPYYSELRRLFHETFLKAAMGQCLEAKYSRMRKCSEFNLYRYRNIVKFKTSYAGFHLPVAAAMIMGEVDDKVDNKDKLEALLLDIGLLFRVQNDFLNSFGDANSIGKVGTDIRSNRCTWLIIKAYELASPKQRFVLKENYGHGSSHRLLNTMRVMQVYRQLNLSKQYLLHETETFANIVLHIEDFPGAVASTKELFRVIAKCVYGREK